MFIQINSFISHNSVYHKKVVIFWSIPFSISTLFKWSMQFKCQKTVLCQTIRFSISTQFSYIEAIYLFSVPPPDKYGTRPFLKSVRTQGRSPHASCKIQKYLRPRRHPPKGAPQRPGNKQQTIGELFPSHWTHRCDPISCYHSGVEWPWEQ